jgi:hypothetical protein
VWSHPHTSAVIKALSALMHEDASVEAALKVYDRALEEEKDLQK